MFVEQIRKFEETLADLDLICMQHALPDVEELWTLAYPDDPMTLDDFAHILWEALDENRQFDPFIPDNIQGVLYDLNQLGYGELAELVSYYLRNA